MIISKNKLCYNPDLSECMTSLSISSVSLTKCAFKIEILKIQFLSWVSVTLFQLLFLYYRNLAHSTISTSGSSDSNISWLEVFGWSQQIWGSKESVPPHHVSLFAFTICFNWTFFFMIEIEISYRLLYIKLNVTIISLKCDFLHAALGNTDFTNQIKTIKTLENKK